MAPAKHIGPVDVELLFGWRLSEARSGGAHGVEFDADTLLVL